MAIVKHPPLQPITDDRDDYRPNSSYLLLADQAPAGIRVENLVTILEKLAPNDRVPLHIHPVAELITFHRGSVQFTLGNEIHDVVAPTSVFVPPGTPHGYKNGGSEPAELQAVFPASNIAIEYLERNPAPGTEGAPPSSYIYDVLTGTVTELPRGPSGPISE